MRAYQETLLNQYEIDALKKNSVFNYGKIPFELRLGKSPTDLLIVYKGAQRGRELHGFLSNSVENRKLPEVERAREIVESGSEQKIWELINNHTSSRPFSAFLSTTFNPEMAQMFAPTINGGSVYTIYRIVVPASRCIYDAFDTGSAGASGEILVLGAIFPDEISAVKVINDDFHSELSYINTGGTTQIKWRPDLGSMNRMCKDEENWRLTR